MMSQSDTDLTALITRLSLKPSVQSVLVLSRADGAIIRATGLITRPTSPDHPLAAEYAAAVYKYVKASEELVGELEGIDGGVLGGMVKKEDVAASEEEIEKPRDDVKLVRLRTKRRELVVVPGEFSWRRSERRGG
ncbi:hypothetical protein FN846DRAFT_959605 [Sphaerosporella brunnea]|uniref:Roadblock/LAMTOR2 domain-containing protein n=1 Tax=Sphaerosporella brunnea TaxID=1250544 RepID=A0A5J5ERV0_9PEZI|nr:hypothetical protein FN846DRAFT_959605 [Sphaerosporella brunnea]